MPPFFSYFPALEKRNELSKFIRGSGNCPRGSSPAYAGLSGIWSLKKREAGFFCAYAQKKDLPFRYLYAILKIGKDMKKFIIPLTVIAVGAAVAIEMIGKRRDYGEINDREE